ncbi:MAG: TIGR02147 family protein [Chitinivibrionales bacterium]|nr:TIGR02147 family protein [Chitinivibrionales bacterium]
MPNVLDYVDYREFLKDYYEENKKRNPAFSYRYIASKVGFKSPGFFTQILNGATNISNRMIGRFVEFIGLKRREAEYFELLVNYNQASGQAEKKRYFERLSTLHGASARVLSPQQYEFYTTWYYSAILDILEFYPYTGNSVELARMVQPSITPAQARRAVAVLVDLGLVRKTQGGRYESCQANLSARPEGYTVALAGYAMEMLDRAREAVDSFPKQERSISWAGFSVSEETFERIQQEIRAFRQRILAIAQNDPDPSRAFHMNIQVFPTSRPLRTNQKGDT